MDLREAAQMALDDLECLIGYAKKAAKGHEIMWLDVAEDIGADVKLTIKALRAALAAPPEELDLPKVQLWEFLKLIEGKEDFRGIPLMRTEWPTQGEALAQPEQEELGEIVPADEEQLKRIAKLVEPEQEPKLYMAFDKGEIKYSLSGEPNENFNWIPLYTAPPHFLDPAKVARLIDEAFERGKKEVDMEQVKDIAQKLADCALLNSAPPQREWQGLTFDDWPLPQYEYSADFQIGAQWAEAKLREKNT